MGDNQERELFGQESTYSEIIAHKISSVAIRSIEQDLFSKFLVQYAVDEITTAVQVGTQPPTILHLGDLLDYSCASEFEKVSRQPWASYPQLFIAPGNHDVIFQGNASYLSDLGEALLRLKKIVNPAIDPTLAGHHNAVCRTQNRPIAYIPPEVLAMKQLPRYAEIDHSPRQYPGVRELPQRFRCDYLKLKARGGVGSKEVEDYCSDVLFYSYYKVKNASQGLPPTEFPLAGRPDHWVGIKGGESLHDWARGYLIQRISVPVEGTPAGGRIVVILLDTTDWSSTPTWAAWKTQDDASKGELSKGQRDVVDRWIAEAAGQPEVRAVLLAGHYPLKAMSRASQEWLLIALQAQNVAPVYLSAHTHAGHEDLIETTKGTVSAAEINVGSLVDAPLHYRSLSLRFHRGGKGLRVDSNVHSADSLCQRTVSLRTARSVGFESGQTFLDASGPFDFDPRDQWCVRLNHVNKVLSRHVPFQGVDHATCVSPQSRRDAEFLKDYVQAEEQLIAAANRDLALSRRLACEAVGGADALRFHAPSPRSASIDLVREGARWVLAPVGVTEQK